MRISGFVRNGYDDHGTGLSGGAERGYPVLRKALRHNAGAEGFDGHCKRGVCTYDLPESFTPKGKIGVLEAGSYADLLLVDGDPTKSVSVLADTDHLRLIMKGGTVYKNTLC